MDINVAKSKLIQYITEIQSDFLIRHLLAFVSYYRNQTETKAIEEPDTLVDDPLALARVFTPEFISLEQLKTEQKYSIESLKATHRNIDHSLFADEDIDELLTLT
jgi:hypothetical protein